MTQADQAYDAAIKLKDAGKLDERIHVGEVRLNGFGVCVRRKGAGPNGGNGKESGQNDRTGKAVHHDAGHEETPGW